MDDRIVREHRELDHAVLSRLSEVPPGDQGQFFTAQTAADQAWIERFEMPIYRRPFWPWDDDAQKIWKAIVFMVRQLKFLRPDLPEVQWGLDLQQWSGRLYANGPTRWRSGFVAIGSYVQAGNVIDWWRSPHEQDGMIGPKPPDWEHRLND